ncbi:baseplate J/gp47 family protein [Bartonella sp. HY761]|uniref:baseplate J/gp47 family protein n=1 Tax=Bartonella sp. HY761 TaxID=2979330 RepID=UPI0021FA5C7E|nr:baseplate J/gp47 family protein [Bartonella sp. HY761]UXN07504.1 baseplate J/gp47 family protein [Bartonella sp. HY761]
MRRDREGPYSLEALLKTPLPQIYETDPLKIRDRMITQFEQATGRKLYHGQVEMYLIETWAYGLSLAAEEAQRQALDYLVPFASVSGLSQLATNRWTPRLPAAKASVILTFTLNQKRNQNTLIPADTRVSAGSGNVIFLTQNDAIIEAGKTSIEVLALASEAGVNANNLTATSITTFLDPIAGLSVSNTVAPDGGADIEPLDAWRLRIANAPKRISRAGPADAYRETVMGVSSAIVDCAIVRPEPCYINIYVLTLEGDAKAALKTQVLAALDPETVRPLGDEVTIKNCEGLECALHIIIRCRFGAGIIEAEAKTLITKQQALWREKLGGVIAPSDLAEPIKHIAGVIDVDVQGLLFQQLKPWQFMDKANVTIEMVVVNAA